MAGSDYEIQRFHLDGTARGHRHDEQAGDGFTLSFLMRLT
jgi:hypothetical protein